MKSILPLLALLLASPAYATQDDCGAAPKGAGQSDAIAFNPTTGNITAAPDATVQCAPASVQLTVPSNPVPLGGQFNVSWTSTGTIGAQPCLANGGSGTTWANGAPLAPSGSRTMFAPLSAGTATFGIECQSTFGPVSDTKNVTFGDGGGNASVSLTGPAQSGLAEPFTLTWSSTGTTGATPCTPLQGTAGWAQLGPLPASGSRTLTGPTSSGNATFRLSCTAGSSNVTDTHTVNFQLLPPDCSGVELPPTVFSFVTQNWDALYGGPFPEIYSANRSFNIFPGQGLVMSFTPQIPGASTPNGSLTYNEHNGSKRRGFMTISRCARDFRVDVLNTATQRCHTGPEAAGQLNLGFRLTTSDPFKCNLIPGVPYFVNIHFGNTTVGPDNSICTPGPCAIIGGTQGFGFRIESQNDD